MPITDPTGPLTSLACLKREPSNPVLAPKDVPYNPALVFNAGITKWNGRYVMVFRNDYHEKNPDGSLGPIRGYLTDLGMAWSEDGVNWTPEPKPVWRVNNEEIGRVYDPRLTVINEPEGPVCYMCFAVDTRHGVRGGIARCGEDLKSFEILSLSVPDNRNMVLFPEKVNGQYVRLERPMPVYGRGGRDQFDCWLSMSPDLVYWGNSRLVLGVEHVPFANDKVGPGAPPVKTDKGWLTTFHAVDRDDTRGKNGWEDAWKKRYTAGIMLLDLNEPWKIIGMSQEPLIAPEVEYETDGGFRNDVIFPGGMVKEDDGTVKIYYGSADTVECLATAKIDDLIAACKPVCGCGCSCH